MRQAVPDIPSLVQRLHSSRKTEQAPAAATLARHARLGQEQCDAVAAAGAVRPLVQLLRSSSLVVQKPAAYAMSCVMHSSGARAAAVAEGGIAALLDLLRSSDATCQQNAADALTTLSGSDGDSRHSPAIAAAGAAPAMVWLCSSAKTEAARASAAATLCNLAFCPDSREAVVAAGGLEAIACILSSSSGGGSSTASSGDGSTHHWQNLALRSAATAVANIVRGGPGMQAAIAASSVPQALVQLLRGSPIQGGQSIAAQTIRTLSLSDEPEVRAAIAAAGGIEALAEQLASSSSHSDLLAGATAALANLVFDSAQRCAVVAATGCIPHLLRLLRSSAVTPDLQELAAGAVANLCGSECPAACEALLAAGAPQVLADLLSSSQHAAMLGYAATAIHNLAVSGHLGAADAAGLLAVLGRLCSSPEAHVSARASEAAETLRQVLGSPAAGAATAAAAGEAHAGPAGDRTAVLAAAEQQQQQRPPRVCAAPGCGATANLRRCGGCSAVRYCSPACAKAHWRAHKADCRRLQAERAAAQAAAAASCIGGSSNVQ